MTPDPTSPVGLTIVGMLLTALATNLRGLWLSLWAHNKIVEQLEKAIVDRDKQLEKAIADRDKQISERDARLEKQERRIEELLELLGIGVGTADRAVEHLARQVRDK